MLKTSEFTEKVPSGMVIGKVMDVQLIYNAPTQRVRTKTPFLPEQLNK